MELILAGGNPSPLQREEKAELIVQSVFGKYYQILRPLSSIIEHAGFQNRLNPLETHFRKKDRKVMLVINRPGVSGAVLGRTQPVSKEHISHLTKAGTV